MKFQLVLVCSLFCTCAGFAQTDRLFGAFAGYGLYDGIHAGGKLSLNANTSTLAVSIGFAKNYRYSQTYYVASFDYSTAIFRNNKSVTNNFYWYANAQIMLWQLADNAMVWQVISVVPSIQRNFYIQKNNWIEMRAGTVCNLKSFSQRKTNDLLGRPRNFMPNICLRLNFKL